MVEDEFSFPIGCPLIGLTAIEDQEFGGDELCLNEVRLIFQDTAVILQPLADTDEIEIGLEPTSTTDMDVSLSVPSASQQAPQPFMENTQNWGDSFIGKKLQTVWVCENDQGYCDQVIFAFEQLHPSIAFVAEGSVLKAFRSQQINKVKASMRSQSSVNEIALAAINSIDSEVLSEVSGSTHQQ